MKIKKFICSALALCSFLCGCGGEAAASVVEQIKDSETIETTTETFASKPFFDDEFADIDPTVGESVNITYDTFPLANNPTNFQSHGETNFANINGKTVSVEAFYRLKNEALNDPNAGFGLLVYQCIRYKMKHPEEAVSISFSTYRFSITTSVCVLPESRYYGYMRALYDSEYDSNGFVRIAYMLVEAAKLGIDVTIVGQLNSYAVKQYNAAGKLVSKGEPSYKAYFNAALEQPCYTEYVGEKKVSDYMDFKPVEWTVNDKGSTDMMHVKACAVSHYLDTEGEEHGGSVWFSSTNLDAISYCGANGNNGEQSGVIVSDHEELYLITTNFIRLMADYDGQEEIYLLRNLVRKRNTEQIALIQGGRESAIPKEEKIVYLGSDTDNIFELYFTPLGGEVDVWDIVNNPYCKFIQKFYNGDGPFTFTWNVPTYSPDFFISSVMQQMVERVFTRKKSPQNVFYVKVPNYDVAAIKKLKVGEDIGYAHLQTGGSSVHSKDIMLSYAENGVQQYVSLISSCNFHMGAPYYQTNFILMIKETEQTGNSFFQTFGYASTAGAIQKN